VRRVVEDECRGGARELGRNEAREEGSEDGSGRLELASWRARWRRSESLAKR
jgi:hypothetical protein